MWWVRNPSRKCKPFETNRISEIQRLSAPGKWNHVKAKENLADLLYQGISIEDLGLSGLWWYGPENSKNGNNRLTLEDRPKYKKRTSFKLSWCQMSYSQLHHTTIMETKSKVSLIMEKNNESLWLDNSVYKKCQKISSSNKLIYLQPSMGDYGVLRSNSRILNAEFLQIETRYSVILHRTSWVTKLIIKQFHEDGHCYKHYSCSSISKVFDHISNGSHDKGWKGLCGMQKKVSKVGNTGDGFTYRCLIDDVPTTFY